MTICMKVPASGLRRHIGVNLRIFLVSIRTYRSDAALERHSREGGNPGFSRTSWPPACAGVTMDGPCRMRTPSKIHCNPLKLTPMRLRGNDDSEAIGLSLVCIGKWLPDGYELAYIRKHRFVGAASCRD